MSGRGTRHPGAAPHSVRRRLAEITRRQHEKLHVHPVLEKLLDPSLKAAEYARILEAHHGIYVAAEVQRTTMGHWKPFSLAQSCIALSADLARLSYPQRLPSRDMSFATDRESVLGMLYVLHGARFGARVIAKNLSAALPHMPHSYFTLSHAPHLWPDMISELEVHGQDSEGFARMQDGASRTFAAFEAAASAVATRVAA